MKENILIKREEKFKVFQKISIEKSNLKPIYLLIELINTEEKLDIICRCIFNMKFIENVRKIRLIFQSSK